MGLIWLATGPDPTRCERALLAVLGWSVGLLVLVILLAYWRLRDRW